MSDAFGAITQAIVTKGDTLQIGGAMGAGTGTPRHIEFNPGGTKMFVVEGTSDFLYVWTLSTGFDLSTATFDGSEKFDLHKNNNGAKGDGQPRGIHFNTDGTKMFVVGNAADEINQYTLSSGSFDVSAYSNPVTKDITATVGGNAQGIEFNTDGTKMFVVERTGNNRLHEFTLTTGFDISTMINNGSHVKSNVLDDLNTPFGIAFSSDGTKMFVVENSNKSDGTDQTVNEYTLSTGFDITTASFTYSFNYSDFLSPEILPVDIHGVEFSDDGKKMFLMDTKLSSRDGTGKLFEYVLSCPWQLTGECGEEEKQRSGACGFDRDCTAPRITKHGTSETPDGFSINNNIFEENQKRYNKNPTIQGTVGEPVTIKVRAWENMGTDKITLAIAYLAMHDEKPDWRDSTANIEFSIQQDEFKVYDKDKIFSAVGAITEKVEDPYGDNGALELLDITFTIIFAKPMEPSHIGIQTVDYITNYDLVYFENALEILPREIVEVEVSEAPEEVPEESSEPTEESEKFIPEPEPPIKDPEPEVTPAALTKKTVLEFVDENMPAKHYVKRYITETEYKEWFDVNYSNYKFWEGIGITQERFDELVLEIESEPEPKMIQTGFVFVPEDKKSLPLVEETYEPEPPEVEPVKEEKKGFFDWLFDLFN